MISRRLGPAALASMLPAAAGWRAPKYRALAEEISSLLFDGRIAPNTALPSERELASQLGISRSTTTAAYRALAERGVLVGRRGSGSVLTLPGDAQVAGLGARLIRPEVDVIDLSVAATPADARVLDLAAAACARLPEYAGSIGYQPYGMTELRERIAQRYTERGAPTTADQLLITNGAQHGLDLLLRSILGPGERVLTELPAYPGALDAIAAAGGRAVAVPNTPDGQWDVPALTATLRQSAPRLAFLIPDFTNPGGALIGTEARAAVLSAARRTGTTVIVDESFLELDLRTGSPVMPAACAALDDAVISLGSLSKPVWGGIRVGWVRAGADLIAQLAVARARSDMSGSALDQLVALALLADPDAILTTRRDTLRQGRDVLLAALADRLPGWQANRPDGGLFLWVRLDQPGSTALARTAQEFGVLLASGSRFANGARLERHLRLPFSQPPPVLHTAVDRLAAAWAQRGFASADAAATLLPI
ncbi:MAG TPA: PLP-dependent aminotransferase family protein [Jatrophihabitans sp.]|nr:PLP-dependent aminotransferase family protein [Jatrophihabitans sp.]